jgi:cell division transport system permease protein
MNPGFVLKESANLFFKGRRISFAASAIFAVVLSIVGVFALGTFYLLDFKQSVEERLEVVIFLSKDADSGILLADISNLEGVSSGSVVTSEQALSEFKQELGRDARLLDILDSNPLPPSIRLRLTPEYRTRAKLDALEQKLKLFKGVEEVWIDRNLLSRLNTFLYVILGADFFILLLVGFSAVLVTMLATRFAILDRRRIIDIYWLMGVSPRTLRAPYVIEGIYEGFFASVISYVIVFVLHTLLARLHLGVGFPASQIAIILAGLGILFGWLGSGLAIDAFKLKRT